MNGPSSSSSIESERSPPGPATPTSAPSAVITEPRSPAGSAWASEPPVVPRLRTSGSAMTAAASAISG